MLARDRAEVRRVRIGDHLARIVAHRRRRRISSSNRSWSGPAISRRPFRGAWAATPATARATSAAAIGWNATGGMWTPLPVVAASAMPSANSRNCVERTIEYGIGPTSISVSWASLALKYPLSGERSIPTIDKATWCPHRGRFRAQQVASGSLEELQHRRRLEGRRVGDINDHRGPVKSLGKPLPRDGVDAQSW